MLPVNFLKTWMCVTTSSLLHLNWLLFHVERPKVVMMTSHHPAIIRRWFYPLLNTHLNADICFPIESTLLKVY